MAEVGAAAEADERRAVRARGGCTHPTAEPTLDAANALIFSRTTAMPRSSLALSSITRTFISSGLRGARAGGVRVARRRARARSSAAAARARRAAPVELAREGEDGRRLARARRAVKEQVRQRARRHRRTQRAHGVFLAGNVAHALRTPLFHPRQRAARGRAAARRRRRGRRRTGKEGGRGGGRRRRASAGKVRVRRAGGGGGRANVVVVGYVHVREAGGAKTAC